MKRIQFTNSIHVASPPDVVLAQGVARLRLALQDAQVKMLEG